MGKRYVVTTAVPGARLNRPFYNSILKYCQLNNAKLLVLPSTPIYKEDTIDQAIPDSIIVTTEKLLNSKIRLSNIPINPQSVDPVAGLTRQSQTDGSFIFASPKLRLKLVPNSNIKLPHALMTPGAVTKPYYRPTRVGMIASQDHVNGALIVEVADDVNYHFRQVQADSEGRFIDLGYEYNQTGKRFVGAEALIPGDLHFGSTDPKVEAVIKELASHLKPRYLFIHDGFDGLSVNHHLNSKTLSKGKIASTLSLSKELDLTALKYKEYSKLAKYVIDVNSNHTDFLHQWLEAGMFLKESHNQVEGLELAWIKSQGKDPFQYALKKRVDLPNVKFLGPDEDFKITSKRIQCGAHGHLGPNGARGSTVGMEKSYANSVTGHSHTPEILRQAWVVGTSTHLKLSYNKGASSWLASMCIVYHNGQRQLINVIDGKYRA